MSPSAESRDESLSDELTSLSPAGASRRQALLQELKTAVVRRRRLRVVARWGAMLILAGVAALVGVPRSSPTPLPVVTKPGPLPAIASPRAASASGPLLVHFEMVSTAPEILAKYLVETAPRDGSPYADDSELLAFLAEAHRPAGIVRTAGKMFLLGEGFR